jgi:hypothetical protein
VPHDQGFPYPSIAGQRVDAIRNAKHIMHSDDQQDSCKFSCCLIYGVEQVKRHENLLSM